MKRHRVEPAAMAAEVSKRGSKIQHPRSRLTAAALIVLIAAGWSTLLYAERHTYNHTTCSTVRVQDATYIGLGDHSDPWRDTVLVPSGHGTFVAVHQYTVERPGAELYSCYLDKDPTFAADGRPTAAFLYIIAIPLSVLCWVIATRLPRGLRAFDRNLRPDLYKDGARL
jgi:hypothetical protein